jgi:predicted small integral membrane protein
VPHVGAASRVPNVTTTSGNRRWWHVAGSLPAAVAVLVACNALHMTLVVIGNLTDYDTNYAFVQHVLSMDTTNFGANAGTNLDPDIMWRAITEPVAWNIAYIGIIVWESAAAIVLLIALVHWVRAFVTRGPYDTAKALSSIGLVMIVILFFAGFIAIGGERFSMWRSMTWNGEDTAFRGTVLAALTLVLIHSPIVHRQPLASEHERQDSRQ